MTSAPKEQLLPYRGLLHHVVTWGDGPRLALLLHGWLDLARLFDGLATRLLDRLGPGVRLAALDFRGHGDSGHVGPEGAYLFFDFVADVHGVSALLSPDRPFALIGHSMGGAVGHLFAGSFPERVSHLVSIEGLGLPRQDPDLFPTRMRGYAEDVAVMKDEPRHRFATVEAAAERVHARNPHIGTADALQYARHNLRETPDGWAWKFDFRLHVRGPAPFLEEHIAPFFARTTCPVLVIEGEHGFRLDDATRARRLGWLARVERRVIAGAAHHVHLDAPDEVAGHIATFLTA